YLALGDGPPGFGRNVSCSAVLSIHSGGNAFSIKGLLPALADHAKSIHLKHFLITPDGVSCNSHRQACWCGLVPARAPLLRKSHLLFLPPGTEMFQFPGYAASILCIQIDTLLHYEQRVSPFGNPRFAVYLRLPEAYRC